MGVEQIVIIRVPVVGDRAQVDRAEWDVRACRVRPTAGDVVLRGGRAHAAGTAATVRRKAQSLKQVVGRAILLKDDDNVRQIIIWRWELITAAVTDSAASIQAQEKSSSTKQEN